LTGLVLVHGVLHWNSALLAYRPKVSPPYLMVQGVLAFAIASIIRTTTFSAILFPALIGEAVGVIRERRTAAVVVTFQLFLWAINFVWLNGWRGLPSWGLSILLIVSMVVFYVLFFVRQAEARARAETLLQELESAHRQLAEYAANVEELTLATERERVARELHDTLAQGLAGLILQLEAADAHLAGERPARVQ
jgi:NarL family two-component system sensor histidine kinase YdfH